jgi:hypothetical protein
MATNIILAVATVTGCLLKAERMVATILLYLLVSLGNHLINISH